MQKFGNNNLYLGKYPVNEHWFEEQLQLLDCSDMRVLANFIVLEGVDGAGISTQAKWLEQHFGRVGRPCERSAEPGSGRSGRHIRSILQGKHKVAEKSRLPQYFAADRAEHVWGPGGICTRAESGIYCISERYLFSSLVYQGLDAGAPLCEIWALNRAFPLPEHLFYLDICAETADKRIAEREREEQSPREIFEKQEFLARVRSAYLSLFKNFESASSGMRIHHLDGANSREVLHQQIVQCLNESEAE